MNYFKNMTSAHFAVHQLHQSLLSLSVLGSVSELDELLLLHKHILDEWDEPEKPCIAVEAVMECIKTNGYYSRHKTIASEQNETVAMGKKREVTITDCQKALSHEILVFEKEDGDGIRSTLTFCPWANEYTIRRGGGYVSGGQALEELLNDFNEL